MDVTGTVALAVGAAAATGLLLVARELVPAPPALGASLRRLHPGSPEVVGGRTPMAVAGRRLPVRLPLPGESLALLGRTPAEYYAGLAAGAAAGLALPVVLAGMFAAAGRLPLSAAVAAGGVAVGLAAAGLGALTVHFEVTSRAGRIRRQFRPVVATYLSLVAMERAAGHGSVESLERAAQVGDGQAVRRIREALQRARTHHRPPWEELQAVAAQLGVPELGDVAQIMQNSGVAGAQVHHTLLQRARSLRDQIRTEALAEAERTTTKLEIPGVLLLVLLVAYFLYPLTRQIEL
jgi:tight adherence protein C